MTAEERREKWRIASRKYRQSAKGKLAGVRSRTAFMKRYPAKHRAHTTVNRAVKSGELIRPSVCSIKDDTCHGRIEGHHEDYEKRLEVIWLCQYHHTRRHNDE